MELLIIKSRSGYIRIKDGEYILCNLDKASVFPLEKVEQVKKHLEEAKSRGIKDAGIFKLVIKEEEFEYPEV